MGITRHTIFDTVTRPNKGTVEKGLGHLFITSSGSHVFNKINFVH